MIAYQRPFVKTEASFPLRASNKEFVSFFLIFLLCLAFFVVLSAKKSKIINKTDKECSIPR